jgi:hypothetical protein
MRLAGAEPSTDELEALAFERVASPCDDDRFRNIVERGSLSWFPSAAFPTPN